MKQKSRFAKLLLRNIFIRIIQRRDDPYRLAKFTGKAVADTLKGWCSGFRSELASEKDEDVLKTVPRAKSTIDVILQYRSSCTVTHRVAGEPSEASASNDADDSFDDFAELMRTEEQVTRQFGLHQDMTDDELEKLYVTGSRILSPALELVINTFTYSHDDVPVAGCSW